MTTIWSNSVCRARRRAPRDCKLPSPGCQGRQQRSRLEGNEVMSPFANLRHRLLIVGVVLSLALLASACRGGPPTAPTAATAQPGHNTSPTAPWPINTRQITGQVLNANDVP